MYDVMVVRNLGLKTVGTKTSRPKKALFKKTSRTFQ